ncbi:Winged helix DNA-binding domain-containing protein [Amycolatopsis arida]|uniref:Winged helix DNA-binding domain-containing protein n=1 Tax=Amycolatopsis arida TaxID=587909 RepID=A0A1I5Z234_9PSEU|nr:winged helix DNA-binding domain-containing protein [Amycolatopsis arida]TDX90056.1 winged helix DNA-binding protein [Amycolatopsis arida]SFQ50511.1 Winged helix DNA-binding domain-containing protein [Amycolatopsis arida]
MTRQIRRVPVAERRARLARRHRLVPGARAERPEDVAESLVALHATDPATVHLSAAARLRDPAVAAVERALYTDRTLVRMIGMRRTMFVVPTPVAPVVQAACAGDIARAQRRQLARDLTAQGHPEPVPDADRWLAEVLDETAAALERRGSAMPKDLTEDVPRLRQQLHMARGKPYAAIGYVTTRVLNVLSMEGRIVRGRPRGTWLSSQYEWHATGAWLRGGLPALDPHAARVELARRWLAAFGPAPVEDLRWWTGWTVATTKKALADLGPVEVDLDGIPGLVLADDLDPVPEPDPWVALLPSLDPTPMGWAGRDWFLGPHRAALFDRNGNVGPTVWCDGRIVGGWAQRPDGEIAVRLLEDVGAEAEAAVAAEADRWRRWFGDVRVVPRFPSPLQRELVS